MTDLDAIIEHAEQHCRGRGTRLTEKRKHVLISLLKSERAMSAYELIDCCKEMFNENIPAMSVYRILEFLQEEQLVHKLNLANKYVACSHITCDHPHEVSQFLICNQCSSVKEISVNRSLIDTLKQNVEDAEFELLSPQLELKCLCQNCATAV